MSMPTPSAADAPSASDPARTDARGRFALLAAVAALYTYALIVFGGIVRITGSGMGCGDDWPRCNGEWIPAFDFATLIEYGHRLLAAGLIIPIAAVVIGAWRNRARPGFGGRGGALRPIIVVVALLAVQIALGAVTVKLELPAGTTVLHFVTASLILAALLIAVVRVASPGAGLAHRPAGRAGGRRGARAAYAAVALGLLAVVFGALTANTGAAPLCQGFPLCNGQWVPEGAAEVHIHWTHRVIAFALFFHVLGAAIAAWRRDAPAPVRTAAAVCAALVTLQLVVAAALVLLRLPQSLQALHLAVGTALWAALVVWAAVAASVSRRSLEAAAMAAA